MKGLVWHGQNELRLEDVREPVCGEGEILLQVKSAGICGSDLMIYAGKHKRARPPRILGHEFAGVVVERRGATRPAVRVGDRVAVNPNYACGDCELCQAGNGHICEKKGLYGVDADGGFALYTKVSLKSAVLLPEEVSYEQAVLIEPLAVAVRAVSVGQVGCGKSILVIGGGPIGLLIAMVARVAGARVVLVIEPQRFRRQLAESLRFQVLNPDEANLDHLMALTGGRGVDVVFDAAGVASAARTSMQLVKRAGRIVVVAVYKEPVAVDLATLGYGEIEVRGTTVYTPAQFAESLGLVAENRVDPLSIVTERLSLADGIHAIEGLSRGMDAAKILLTVN
jgi:(R,R)-butanediol dehydrogenase / meso-butanediol dehydrogenase / diacetyl reductase